MVSTNNYKYYLIIVDHYTRYTWLYPLKLKSHVKETFIKFKALVENKFQTKIVTLFSDNGGEYIALKSFLATHGISHLTTPPHTPEHNGLSERRHRHIVETGLSLLTHACIPNTYWTYAFSAAVYLINRMPTPILSLQSPFQKLFQTNPNYEKLKIFGCLCFPWLRPYNNNKLDPKSSPCVFLGYSLTQSAYLCLEPSSQRIYVSRHVRFDETSFPFKTLQSSIPSTSEQTASTFSSTPIPFNPPSLIEISNDTPSNSGSSPLEVSGSKTTASSSHSTTSSSSAPSSPAAPPSPAPSSPDQPISPALPSPASSVSRSPSSSSHNSSMGQEREPQSESMNQAQETQKDNQAQEGQQDNRAQSRNNNAASSSHSSLPPLNPANTHQMETQSKKGIAKPNTKYSLAMTLVKSPGHEPRTPLQALKDEKWRHAMSEEYNAQLANHTWDLVPPPPTTVNIMGCKWIFTTKYNPDGSIRRYKARLVAKGYNQQA